MHSLSSFTDDIGLRREPKGSALPKFPSSVSDGGWFRGYTGSLLRCGLSSCSPPCTDLTRNFPQPTGTFTPELPASRSPFSSSGITTVATERFHRWDFHPLECQLASLHRLFHPLHSCRFIPAHINLDCAQNPNPRAKRGRKLVTSPVIKSYRPEDAKLVTLSAPKLVELMRGGCGSV